jgi:hypothetical protein
LCGSARALLVPVLARPLRLQEAGRAARFLV